jgi:[ribosomal protein S5]-alanine N-acetyltransferase
MFLSGLQMLALNFTPFPVLETHRLSLRRIEQSDVNEIFFLRSDAKVLEYLDRPPTKTLEEASAFIEMLHKFEHDNESIIWAITLLGEKQLIGTICFWNIKKEHHRAEIGYVLHPQYQSKGIMHEALAVVLDYGYKIMKLHSVEANVNPANLPSARLLERNKFGREGYFKENYYYNGKYFDSAIYSLLFTDN